MSNQGAHDRRTFLKTVGLAGAGVALSRAARAGKFTRMA
jgi:hypothetical protein